MAHSPSRRRIGVGIIICAVFVVASACGSTAKQVGTISTPSPSMTTEISTPSPSATATHSGPTHFSYGDVGSVTQGGVPAATLSVSSPETATSFIDGLSTPTVGPAYVTFNVHITAITAGFTYNEFDFYVRGVDGSHYAASNDRSPALNSGTLNVGEAVSGYLTFDAGPHGTLVYAPNSLGGSIGEWSF